jgi:hypothetical protein
LRHTSFGTADGVRRIDRDPGRGRDREMGRYARDQMLDGLVKSGLVLDSLVLDGLPQIDFRCREFSGMSDSAGRLVETVGRAWGRTTWGFGLAARGGQSWAILRNRGAREQDERKSRRPPRILDCRESQRARRHVGQRLAGQARRERLRRGTSWPYSTPDRVLAAVGGGVLRGGLGAG